MDSKDYLFTSTQDWVSHNVASWTRLIPLITSSSPRVLEIGSWEGRSAVWALENICKPHGSLVCIDHFDLMATSDGRKRYEKLVHNLTLAGGTFRVLPKFSVPGLITLLEEEMKVSEDAGFDWIYVDGSHEADDTFLDAELVWRLARTGSVIIFDDYKWPTEPATSMHHPKRGIDGFLKLHEGQFQQLSEPESYQMVIRKQCEMRIGFLVKPSPQPLREYGMNIAFAVDSSYAIPTAVALRSICEHTPSRLTFYIIDFGLQPDEKEKIVSSLASRPNMTVNFMDPPAGGLVGEWGMECAKIDALKVLPVERVLYLDGDVLAISDLRPLWDMDLSGNPLGAIRDTGYPSGPESFQKATKQKNASYFNSGVLLLNLTMLREDIAELERTARDLRDSKFRDQNALNVHFIGRWKEFGYEFNAQGLGTYGKKEENPILVHFTGPVDPGMELVLNPWVQPWTSKPWGYAGAPGHPYTQLWWDVLDNTAWKGYNSSEEFSARSRQAADDAVKDAIERFEQTVLKKQL